VRVNFLYPCRKCPPDTRTLIIPDENPKNDHTIDTLREYKHTEHIYCAPCDVLSESEPLLEASTPPSGWTCGYQYSTYTQIRELEKFVACTCPKGGDRMENTAITLRALSEVAPIPITINA
jgi:hypothetical protein